MSINTIGHPPPAERAFSLVGLSIAPVKKATSFSGLTRESRRHGNKILASSARMTTSGFSLVELSIVLVILGLLTGGILTGQNLIRAAELRSITTEFTAFQTAVNTFRDKYFALPGDMTNAQDFWGVAHATINTCRTTVGSGKQTCNGNGDGRITDTVGYGNEVFRFWQHLTNAGLIEGQYTGVQGTSNTVDHDTGINAPASKADNMAWGVIWGNGLDASWFSTKEGNQLLLGTASGSYPFDDGPNTEEIWSIDKKIDDGKPGTGILVVTPHPNCSTASSETDYAAEYNFSYTLNTCTLVFPAVF